MKKAIVFSYINTNISAFVVENLEYPQIDDTQIKNYCQKFFDRLYENVTIEILEHGIVLVAHSKGYSKLTWSWVTSFKN